MIIENARIAKKKCTRAFIWHTVRLTNMGPAKKASNMEAFITVRTQG